uniref:ATP-dependent Clp protease proteolytic subunit n=1 Tax=Corydalis conspersa TaxID=2182691 RepID=A0A6G8J2Z8_9MAGN|nr:clp protease proteolytic subunit [Corydalis conspersa]QIM61516.1 clp protease proteolytic subunit [Corydalis conspersa]
MDVLHYSRIIFVGQKLTNEIANNVQGLLIGLSRANPKHNFNMLINCKGGWATAGIAVADTMDWVTPNVTTLNVGTAFSVGSLILCAGQKGDRIAYPNSSGRANAF